MTRRLLVTVGFLSERLVGVDGLRAFARGGMLPLYPLLLLLLLGLAAAFVGLQRCLKACLCM